jgi:hypothetical protein
MRALRASTVLVLVLVLARGALPPCALACSCMPIGPLADYVADGTTAVMAGTVGAGTGADRYAFVVERWYAGPGAAPIVTVAGGDPAMCGVPLAPGDRLVFAATRDEEGVFHPSNCMPFARVTSDQGAALLAEAERTFGDGGPTQPTAEPTAEPQAPQPSPTPDGTAAVSPELVAGFAVTAGIAVLGVAILVARSRRADA